MASSTFSIAFIGTLDDLSSPILYPKLIYLTNILYCIYCLTYSPVLSDGLQMSAHAHHNNYFYIHNYTTIFWRLFAGPTSRRGLLSCNFSLTLSVNDSSLQSSMFTTVKRLSSRQLDFYLFILFGRSFILLTLMLVLFVK